MVLLRLKNSSLFVLNSTESDEENKNKFVPKNYQTISKLPKQLDYKFASTYEGMINGVKTTSEVSMVTIIATNLLMTGGMFLIWGIVNTL